MFDIGRGEILGIVGESGCGKSTLARLILRLIEPTRGQILFEGRDVGGLGKRELRHLRPKMQMVFQDPHSPLDPRNSIYRSLVERFQIQKVRMAPEAMGARIVELLTMVGLKPEHCRAYPHQLSGGQKQRAVIARALPSHLSLSSGRADSGPGCIGPGSDNPPAPAVARYVEHDPLVHLP